MNAFLNGEKETREQISLNFGLRKDLQLGVHFAIPSVIPWWVCSAKDDAPSVFGRHRLSSFFLSNKGSWDKLWSCLMDKAEI